MPWFLVTLTFLNIILSVHTRVGVQKHHPAQTQSSGKCVMYLAPACMVALRRFLKISSRFEALLGQYISRVRGLSFPTTCHELLHQIPLVETSKFTSSLVSSASYNHVSPSLIHRRGRPLQGTGSCARCCSPYRRCPRPGYC